jgi:hypothetical protein
LPTVAQITSLTRDFAGNVFDSRALIVVARALTPPRRAYQTERQLYRRVRVLLTPITANQGDDVMKKSLGSPNLSRWALAVLVMAVLAVAWAAADAPPGPYFNGFEQNTAGWFNNGGTITRKPSFYSNGGGYADGIASASGSYHARLGIDPSPDTCASGGGPQPVYNAPYTNWGGYSSIFPPGGYQTRVDVYLDVSWAQTHPDRRFDWSSAINNTTGQHRRDFVFNAGTEPNGFVISGSNNGTRCGAFPANPGRMPVHVIDSGWYTFEHSFAGVSGGPLTVTMRLINKTTAATVGIWILTDPSDIIGGTVGGNRYGWFVQNEFDGLAIDNSFRTGIVSTPNCELKISDGGWIFPLNGDVATFGGNAKVSSSGVASGNQEYHDHGPLQPMTVNTIDVQAVVCNDDHTKASIFGHTAVNGSGSYEYEIDLEDNGEPGVDDKYRIFVGSIPQPPPNPPTPPYDSGLQTLQGGNVQIR